MDLKYGQAEWGIIICFFIVHIFTYAYIIDTSYVENQLANIFWLYYYYSKTLNMYSH